MPQTRRGTRGKTQRATIVTDARIELALSSLSGDFLLKQTKEYNEDTVWGQDVKGLATWYALATSRLLDKGVIKVAGEFSSGKPAFCFTPLGLIVHKRINSELRQFEEDPKEEEKNA